MTIGLFRAFGISGFLSLLLWALALAGVVYAWRRGGRERPARLAMAAGVALLAVLLARPAAYRIAWMEEDRSEEMARAAKAVAAAEDAGKVTVRFAEETADAKAPEPEYRQRGIQARSREKLDAENKAGSEAESPGAAVVSTLEDDPVVLRMKAPSLLRVRRLDRMNRFGAAAVFWIGLLSLVADYFRKFHSPTQCWMPLPLSSPLLDRLLARPSVVRVPAAALAALLATIIRRGDTFIYCGAQAARVIPDGRLPRWRIGTHGFRWLSKLDKADTAADLEYILDAAWFGRAFVAIDDEAAANRLLGALQGYLSMRKVTRARAARAVYIVWDLGQSGNNPLPGSLMEMTPAFNIHWILPA
jgi:hypothetical protein